MAVQDDFLAATLPALDLIYNLSRRLVRDLADAEDLVQETYTRALDAWVNGRKPRKVEPWIATICLNTGRTWLRRTREELDSGETALAFPDDVDVEAEAIRAVEKKALHAALWALPDEQRIAITLMDIDGFTASEVARVTGAPRGTVLARVHRGRKKLAHILIGERNRETRP